VQEEVGDMSNVTREQYTPSTADEIILSGWTYAQVPAALLLDHAVRDGAKTLFAYLVWRQGQNEKAWPSVETMRKDIGVKSARTIQAYVGALESAGWLTVRSRRGSSNLYTVHATKQTTADPCSELHPPPQIVAPPPANTCTQNDSHSIGKEDTIPVAVAPVASAPVKKRTLSPQQQVHNSKRGEIQEHIEKLTGLTPPSNAKRAGALWWAPITEMCEIMAWDSAGVKALLSTVVAKMRQDNLTISSAKSLVNNFRSEAARESLVQAQKRATVVSSGGKPWWSEGGSMRLPVQTQHGRGSDG
jgi:hypothetical protein